MNELFNDNWTYIKFFMCSNINWENKMTKRFTTKNGVFYTDNLTGWEFQSYGEVVKLMNELSDENEQLKSFIKSLASLDGKIWLSSGYGYRIDKILNDFNNTENDEGDVE